MTYKKTWLSCLLWAVFTCAAAALLALYIISFWKSEVNAVLGIDTAFAVFGVFILIAGCYFIIRVIAHQIGEKCKVSGHTIFLWELFIALCIFFAGLLYRIHLIIQCSSESIGITSFYQQAMLKAGESVAYMEHGMSYLYTLCLSFVLSFLGNKVIAGVWLQVMIQMLTILFGFLAVRKTAGRIPAYAAMLMLAFSPAYVEQIFIMTPEILYLFLYLLGLLIVGSYVKNYCEGQFNLPMAVIGAIICGGVIGVFSYLDAFSLTLLIFMASLFIGVRTTDEDKRFHSLLLSVVMFLLTVVVGGLVLTGGFALDAYTNEEALIEPAKVWVNLYWKEPHFDSLNNYGIFVAGSFQIERFVTVLSAAFLIPAFWNRKKTENVSPWFVLMLLLNSPVTAIGVLEYHVCNMLVWSVLAGTGLQLSLLPSLKAAEPTDESLPSAEVEAVPDVTTALTPDAETKPTSAAEPEKKPVQSPAPPPRFIENPLPLPKKHEKKVMDYQYEVPEDKMKFDIEIDENDDFDIV